MAYNVSKGKNTLEESEILEPIHNCLRELMEYDKQKKAHLLQFSDHDIVAITLLYSQVCGNRLGHNFGGENITPELMKEIANNFGRLIQDLTLAMTRVDVVGHFNEEGSTSESRTEPNTIS